MEALDRQTVAVIGTDAAGLVIPHLAHQLIALHIQHRDTAQKVEEIVVNHPLCPVLTSLLGVTVRTASVILAELSGKTLTTAAALASYKGLAPTTRQPGTSIHSERVSHTGNKRLKRALFFPSFAPLRPPHPQGHYDRKRDQGKRHNQALIALAHQRLTTCSKRLTTSLGAPPSTGSLCRLSKKWELGPMRGSFSPSGPSSRRTFGADMHPNG